ncbi:MAG: SGNH/GDSL hydrolase family protein [Planctomycetes bacterium]|nr:SGNH/GDSL hydrolase family protein [Planctomycetota bacterium]
MTRTDHRSTRRRLVVALAATCASLVAAESVLWIAGLPGPAGDFHHLRGLGHDSTMFEPDPELFWRLRAGDPFEPANAHGLRGPLPAPVRSDRDFVVVCVGDSCTFGAGVRYDDTYGALLERALRRARPRQRIDVVLAAMGGWSSHQDRVLFDRLLASLRPDVTVLYTGLFNDYTPAIGTTDGERAHPSPLRLARLFARARESDRAIAAAEASFVGGKPVLAPRVPLDDYAANVTAIVQRARDAGSAAITVLPPRMQRMFEVYADGRGYLDATRSLARALGTTSIDPAPHFAAFVDRVQGDAREPEDPWPCFVDLGHPSITGHAILAELLAGAILPLVPGAAGDIPRIDADSESSTLPALNAGELVVGLDGAKRIDRAWLGDAWIPELDAPGDTRLRLRLPKLLPSGEFALELRGPEGIARTRRTWRVDALPLSARLAKSAAGCDELVVEGAGPRGWTVGVWLAASRRAAPRSTQFGPLVLEVAAGGEASFPPDAPYRFDRMPPAALSSGIDATERWVARMPVADVAALPSRLFVQALVLDSTRPGFGALSAVAELQR